jgi:ABC-type transport system involved in multi-copper enzyme maturation permease subunit
MLDRILSVAENGWVELVKRKALYTLVAAILGCTALVFIQNKWFMAAGMGIRAPLELRRTILGLDKFVLLIGLCASVLLASGSIETEVSKRTLCSVMIRPIYRWEYLAGRALSVILFFLTFALAAAVWSYGAASIYGSSMPTAFLWGIIQRVCAGTAWIVIALSLASITSSAGAVTLIVVVAIFSALVPHLPNNIHWFIPLLKQFLHYATPGLWTTDFLEKAAGVRSQSLLENGAIALENLMYGVVVFLGSAWVFTQKDLKLRE